MTKLRSVDFVVDRIERGETTAEIVAAEGVTEAQVEAVRAMLDGDEPEEDGEREVDDDE